MSQTLCNTADSPQNASYKARNGTSIQENSCIAHSPSRTIIKASFQMSVALCFFRVNLSHGFSKIALLRPSLGKSSSYTSKWLSDETKRSRMFSFAFFSDDSPGDPPKNDEISFDDDYPSMEYSYSSSGSENDVVDDHDTLAAEFSPQSIKNEHTVNQEKNTDTPVLIRQPINTVGVLPSTLGNEHLIKQEQNSDPPATKTRSRKTVEVSQSTMDFLVKSSNGYGSTTQTEYLKDQLCSVENEIYELNNGHSFNVNSPKQVANVLFGETSTSESTSKDVLEAIAGTGNKIAPLAEKILLYRKIKSDMRRSTLQQERMEREKQERLERKQQKEKNPTMPLPVERDPLLLVDTSAYIFRAYYAMPPLHRQDGTPTGAVLGVCNMINRLILSRIIRGEAPRLVLVFDAKGKNFRHEMYEDYKANRSPCPMDLVPQFDLVRKAADAYGIPSVEASGYEADDVIATLATMALEAGVNVNVVSSDKDLLQLVTPPELTPNLHMVDPVKMGKVSYKDVEEKWGVPPEKLGDVLALAGDSADNIPGVPGIGPKIAAILINEYGGLEELLKGAEKIKQKARREKLIEHADKASLSRKLVELERSVPLDVMNMPFDNLVDFRMELLNENRLLQFYDDMGFWDLKRRVIDRFNGANRSFTYVGKSIGAKQGTMFTRKKKKATVPDPADFEQFPF